MWADKNDDGSLTGWKSFEGCELGNKSIWSLKQDVRQLNEFAKGCKTIFDVPPAYFSPKSGEELRRTLL